jgi:hypothetical protein
VRWGGENYSNLNMNIVGLLTWLSPYYYSRPTKHLESLVEGKYLNECKNLVKIWTHSQKHTF